MNIEEIAFKDRKNLVQLNENDLLDIIEFLQQDRKQWINQFTQTHNESVKIQEKNQELKDNWVELKEFIKKSLQAIDTIQKLIGNTIENYTPRILTYNQILDKMQELEQGSYEED